MRGGRERLVKHLQLLVVFKEWFWPLIGSDELVLVVWAEPFSWMESPTRHAAPGGAAGYRGARRLLADRRGGRGRRGGRAGTRGRPKRARAACRGRGTPPTTAAPARRRAAASASGSASGSPPLDLSGSCTRPPPLSPPPLSPPSPRRLRARLERTPLGGLEVVQLVDEQPRRLVVGHLRLEPLAISLPSFSLSARMAAS